MDKTETVVTEKNYTLRRLKDKDLWPVLDIIGKVFPEEQLTTVFAQIVTKEKTLNEVGGIVLMRLALAVIKNMGVVHDEVYSLLSDLSGIPAKEIEEMEFGTTPAMIWDIVRDAKNASFFKGVSELS